MSRHIGCHAYGHSLTAATCSDVEGALSNEQASKRLRLFVPAAAEMGRQRAAAQLGPKSQLSMVRTALRLGRQVSLLHQTDVQPPQGCHSWLSACLFLHTNEGCISSCSLLVPHTRSVLFDASSLANFKQLSATITACPCLSARHLPT